MTNPPHGGSVTEADTAGTGPSGDPAAPEDPGAPSTEFGTTTLSGRTGSIQGGAPAGAAGSGRAAYAPVEHGADGHTRTDLPPVPVPGPEPVAPTPGPGMPPGSGPASGAIRGIRTGRNRGPRRARLQIRHINPVTVLKFSCVLSIALFFVWLIVIGVLYGILDGAGVIKDINDTVTQLNGTGSKPPVTAGVVFGGAAIVGVINLVLFIALTTIGSVIYNLCADLVGGVEITLSER